jgi:hypothetical protein
MPNGTGPRSPNFIPPQGIVNGKDRNYFIKKYWQAVCPISKENNPIWDNDGSKDESFNDSINEEDLFMLSPSMHPQTPVTRNISVPPDKGLFIPVMSVLVSECQTSEPLIVIANKTQSSIQPTSLSLELDGVHLTALDSYRVHPASIGTFQVNFPSPEDAIFKINNSGPCNAVAAGRYIWTKPLSSGQYSVHFKGNLHCIPPNCLYEDYMEDITYNITVL